MCCDGKQSAILIIQQQKGLEGGFESKNVLIFAQSWTIFMYVFWLDKKTLTKKSQISLYILFFKASLNKYWVGLANSFAGIWND